MKLSFPKIIHQTWKSKEIPEKFKRCVQSIKKHNQGWDYRLWTDEEMLSFVIKHYPSLHEMYVTFPAVIQRCDLFRYLVVDTFGGIYFDLDVLLNTSIDKILANEDESLFFAEKQLSKQECEQHKNRDPLRIANYAFGTTPKHPFWEFIIKRILTINSPHKKVETPNDIFESTGPGMLTTAFHDYNKQNKPLKVHFPEENQQSLCSCGPSIISTCTVGRIGHHMHAGTWRF